MITKKYITRTDLKVAGFSNLDFTVNKIENTAHLVADYETVLGKIKYIVSFDVDTSLERTSQKTIEALCRKMLERLEYFKTLKPADQKKYLIENGYSLS